MPLTAPTGVPRTGKPLRRPRHRAGLALFLVPLLLMAPATARADEPADPDGLDQTVDPDEENVGGEAVLSVGHVDLGPRFVDGVWRIHGRDDSQVPPVWRLLTDVVTQVSEEARQPVPDDEQFAFLGAAPGEDVYVIPQTQAPGVIWLGWNTQDPEVMEQVNRGVTLSMLNAEGPGHFSVFLQDGAFGPPDVLWDSSVADRQDLWVDVNTHTHANWVFTEPGVYVVDIEMSADLIGGERVSDRAALRFAVGEETDVREAFDARALPEEPGARPEGGQRDEGGSVPGGAGDTDPVEAADEDTGRASSALSVPLAVAGGAVVLLLAAVALVTVRGRRARRLAAVPEPGERGDGGR
ncbi:choice-of-anchor M domain-containing protein [Streptomyces carpaticus]|uniref:Choice-of-anchor M domain-containing protein n=1 Tax=Streptomyces carpaticus TaxID=285558 RepID=A0ABV4ZHN3_9ACTN